MFNKKELEKKNKKDENVLNSNLSLTNKIEKLWKELDYEKYTKAKSFGFIRNNIPYEDVFGELSLIFAIAVKTWEKDKKTPFLAWYTRLMYNSIKDIHQKYFPNMKPKNKNDIKGFKKELEDRGGFIFTDEVNSDFYNPIDRSNEIIKKVTKRLENNTRFNTCGKEVTKKDKKIGKEVVKVLFCSDLKKKRLCRVLNKKEYKMEYYINTTTLTGVAKKYNKSISMLILKIKNIVKEEVGKCL
jgi:hypothetical protein